MNKVRLEKRIAVITGATGGLGRAEILVHAIGGWTGGRPLVQVDGIPNGLAFRLLHDFLTVRGSINPNTLDDLEKVHARIGIVLGGIKTTACDVPRWAA